MASYNDGKIEVVEWIRKTVPEGGRILDVGACDGKWARLIREAGHDVTLDACEIFRPNALELMKTDLYEQIFAGDIAFYRYPPRVYDLVIFGDVIEHMEVWKAVEVIAYARKNAKDHLIGVPFCYPQGPLYGNPWEIHVQDDLTPAIFHKRYPGHEQLFHPRSDYSYYHKQPKE